MCNFYRAVSPPLLAPPLGIGKGKGIKKQLAGNDDGGSGGREGGGAEVMDARGVKGSLGGLIAEALRVTSGERKGVSGSLRSRRNSRCHGQATVGNVNNFHCETSSYVGAL